MSSVLATIVQPKLPQNETRPPSPPPSASEYQEWRTGSISFPKPRTTTYCIEPTSLVLPSPTTSVIYLDSSIDSGTYASVLDGCKCPTFGKQVHGHSVKSGFHRHEFVQTKLLQMYSRCASFNDAAKMFDIMPVRNLYSWTAILDICIKNRYYEEAFLLFVDLLSEDFELKFFVFPVVLGICSGYGGVRLGRQLHGIAIKNEFVSNIYVSNAFIDMYGKCRSLDDSKKVLNLMKDRDCVSWNSVITACAVNGMVDESLEFMERMSTEDNLLPNVVSWSAIIGGLSHNGHDEEAIEMFYKMKESGFKPNARTLASVLPACARLQRLCLGKEIHGYITRHGFMSNAFIVNGLVDLYRRCRDMERAQNVFSEYSVKNEVSYNTMIVGYCENGNIQSAKELFNQLEIEGRRKDVITWNSMISGYVNNLMFDEALRTFRGLVVEEIEADSFTLGSSLSACANLSSLRCGKELHSFAIVRGLESNPFVGGSLVEMYCKCEDLKAAERAFHGIIERDTAAWNALISGYARCNQIESVKQSIQKMEEEGFEPNAHTWNGIIAGQVEQEQNELVLELFLEMQKSNFKPDIYSVGIILPVCSRLASIGRGKQVHSYAIRHGFESDAYIGAALIDMYAKCGSINHSKLVYDGIKSYNLVTENAMLTAYAMNGYGEEGIVFFRRLLDEGFRPDEVTFLSVLSSCVHAGSVEIGKECYKLMGHYGVTPTLKHYTCLVDLISRAGKLDEALNVIRNMPMETDVVIWGALLGGCIIHGNVDLGELAANKLIELEPYNTGNHVMLANLYASAGRWEDFARTRQAISDKQLHKSPGCSWIEDRDEIHVFVASDRSHKRANDIYTILDNLTYEMRLEQD
ncbi:hypothetical protein M9H77_26406 [Catharanthus roseus]|uniref:Uncharacterized protein n=1 Tax=Catharanthus roseus TaxID=4058 RepID=A0ACC0A9L7_CATRO|nr:hypothetical protein M9H77_26406 [Catharanthus roseus]